MSIQDLVFRVNNSKVYDPLGVESGIVQTVSVTNYGTEALTNLGFFLVPATSVGDVDNPAEFPPETDYQDLLEWGTSVDVGLTVTGGLKISGPQNVGANLEQYFSRTHGTNRVNKIPCRDIGVNETISFTLTLETPPAVSSRRLFVNVVLE